jgi:hypothetical protein
MNGEKAMNYDGNPNDSVLTMELRDALSELATPRRPPLKTITNRSSRRQRRRLAGFACLGATVAAAVAALALGVTAGLNAAPTRSANAIRSKAPAHSTGPTADTIRTPAFILTGNVNGTDTLTLTMSQVLDAATLQQALTEHDIPALVKSGTYCTSNPAPPDPVSAGVLSIQPPAGSPHETVTTPSSPPASQVNQMAAHTVTVINPAALPSGTELFFGYSSTDHAVFTDLIDTGSYTCSDTP